MIVKKAWLKIIVLLTSVLLACGMLSGCLWMVSCVDEMMDNGADVLELVGEPTMSWRYSEELAQYEVRIEGVVKNPVTQSCEGGSIEFNLYDQAGNGIGTAYEYTSVVLETNDTWRFCATGYTNYEPETFRLLSLYAYGFGLF